MDRPNPLKVPLSHSRVGEYRKSRRRNIGHECVSRVNATFWAEGPGEGGLAYWFAEGGIPTSRLLNQSLGH
jgi:hypothetical protein